MVDAIIEVMLGDVGRYLLARYNEHQFGINLIVIGYGLLSIWAHFNLRRVARQMEALIIDLAAASEPPLDIQRLFDRFRGRWNDPAEGGKMFLPTRTDLWFSIVDRADVIEQLNLQKEFVYVVLSKAGLLEASDGLPRQVYRAWELYRHQLLTGIRSRHLEPEVQLRLRMHRSGRAAGTAEESVNGRSS